MGMIPFRGREEATRSSSVTEHVTLDEVCRRAEQLGRVEVDHALGARNVYRVRIQFERRTGSTVWAEGNDVDIVRALEAAIREAELLSW